MKRNGVSSHGHVERLAANEPFARQVGSQNPEAITAPLELGAIRIEHPEGKRPAGAIDEDHDSVASRPLPAVADRGDGFGVEGPIVTGLEYQIVISEAMRLEVRRAGAWYVSL